MRFVVVDLNVGCYFVGLSGGGFDLGFGCLCLFRFVCLG